MLIEIVSENNAHFMMNFDCKLIENEYSKNWNLNRGVKWMSNFSGILSYEFWTFTILTFDQEHNSTWRFQLANHIFHWCCSNDIRAFSFIVQEMRNLFIVVRKERKDEKTRETMFSDVTKMIDVDGKLNKKENLSSK
jgi:hypothetical protein